MTMPFVKVRCFCLAVCLAAKALAAVGQETVPSNWLRLGEVYSGQSSPSAPHTIQGTVVDSVSGQPIYRALVQIGNEASMLTDHEGRFVFEGMTTNGVPPFAMKPGYFADNHPLKFISSSTQDSLASRDQSTVIKLVPEAILSGTVTAPDGAPLEGIPVQLRVLSTADGIYRWQQRQGTSTNSEGQYRFAELESGRYAVTTGFHVEGLADPQSSAAYIPSRNPPRIKLDGESTAGSSSIMLAAGEHREANLAPPLERLFAVTGVVSSAEEVHGASFRAETSDGEEIAPMSRYNPRTGEFRLMLPTGSYHVTSIAYLPRGPLQAARQITVPKAPINGVSFSLEPYAQVPVELQLETLSNAGQSNGEPPVDVSTNVNLVSIGESNIYLPAQSRRHRGQEQGIAGSPAPLMIENVPPGRYLLQAQPPPPWYVSSALCGGLDLMRENLSVAGSAAGCSIRVTLRNDPGSVHIAIRDTASSAAPATDRQVFLYLLPVGDAIRKEINTSVQGGGDFILQGIAPGRYLALAEDHKVELAYRDPAELRRYASLGQEITVNPNGKTDAELSLDHGEP